MSSANANARDGAGKTKSVRVRAQPAGPQAKVLTHIINAYELWSLMSTGMMRTSLASDMSLKPEGDHLHTWASVVYPVMAVHTLALLRQLLAMDPAISSAVSWPILEARVSQALLPYLKIRRNSSRDLLHIRCHNLLRAYCSRVLIRVVTPISQRSMVIILPFERQPLPVGSAKHADGLY